MDKLIKSFPVRIDEEDRKILEEIAKERRIKLSHILREAIIQYILREKKDEVLDL